MPRPRIPKIIPKVKDGRAVLDYYAYIDGKRCRLRETFGPAVSVETMPAEVRQDVEERAAAIRDEIKRGTHAQRKEDERQDKFETRIGGVELVEFMRGEYLKTVRNRDGEELEPESKRRILDAAKHFAAVFGEHRSILTIDEDDVLAYRTKRLESASKGTVRRELAVLKAVINRFIDWRRLSIANPVNRRVKLPKAGRRNERFHSEDEAAAVLKKCPPILAEVVKFTRTTGMRRGEICSIDWAQVRPQWHVLKLDGAQTKNGEPRDVPLNATALAVLKNIGSREGRVFLGEGGEPLKPEWLTRRFRRACQDAGAVGVRTFHGLRHDFSSQLGDKGVSEVDRALLLGHFIPGVTSTYTHVAFQHLLDVVRLLDPKPAARAKMETKLETRKKVSR